LWFRCKKKRKKEDHLKAINKFAVALGKHLKMRQGCGCPTKNKLSRSAFRSAFRSQKRLEWSELSADRGDAALPAFVQRMHAEQTARSEEWRMLEQLEKSKYAQPQL
jgi:hypothetical protein